MLKLYNTLTREKEEFVPVEAGVAKVYTCGPTVYWHQHVGNFRYFIFSDILKRVLMFNGFDVKHIINVTDVGHLTSDADEGEDKMEKAAKKEGKTASEVSHFYFDEFRNSFLKLKLIEPMKWTWATEHIPEQLETIKTLEEKGYVYVTSDGVYFDSSKFEDYGKLSRKRIDDLEEGKRVDMGEKKNRTDFALWKFSKPEDKRQQEWDSPWGVGFPGWHIECSAMAAKYLGETFDIHTGGEDHIPVHHENEIAQSNCCFDKRAVNYWVHSAFLTVKGGKMSKSLGKIETIGDLESKGIDPLAYRYLCLTAKYRKPLAWNEEAMDGAVNSYRKLKNACLALEDDKKVNEEAVDKFKERVSDDLDMPGGLAVVWDLVRGEEKGKVGALKKMDEVLGLDLLEKNEVEVPKKIEELRDKMDEARKNKNYESSDNLRSEIEKEGFKVKSIPGIPVSGLSPF
ncbi:cysteine--tRNA ligase [archaeon]|jgi:cysteinyl-tRNA synthetase|nr:cysteine--tRNA ligase [archaeon]MBT7128812.1 cysteine--tRNA ligase [archaeon]